MLRRSNKSAFSCSTKKGVEPQRRVGQERSGCPSWGRDRVFDFTTSASPPPFHSFASSRLPPSPESRDSLGQPSTGSLRRRKEAFDLALTLLGRYLESRTLTIALGPGSTVQEELFFPLATRDAVRSHCLLDSRPVRERKRNTSVCDGDHGSHSHAPRRTHAAQSRGFGRVTRLQQRLQQRLWLSRG